jgi:hypothetical protein
MKNCELMIFNDNGSKYSGSFNSTTNIYSLQKLFKKFLHLKIKTPIKKHFSQNVLIINVYPALSFII